MWLRIVLSAAFGVLLTPAIAIAQPGAPDDTFGSNGVVTGPDNYASISAIALRPDGKLVVTGTIPGTGGFVSRYNADGSLDGAFGSDGTTMVVPGGFATSVALQPDGKILVAGAKGNDAVLVRLTSNGSLDSSFGSGGIVTVPGGAGAQGIAVQPDGKVVVAIGRPQPAQVAIIRLYPDGSLDSSFGSGGEAVLPASSPGAEPLLLTPDGEFLVVVGDRLAKLDADGSLDAAYGSHGFSAAIPGASLNASTLAPDDGVIAAGALNGEALLERVLPDGELDPSFGYRGARTSQLAHGQPGDALTTAADAVALQPDGRIVTVGTTTDIPYDDPPLQTDQIYVARYTPAGAIDCSFGRLGAGLFGEGYMGVGAGALQGDGKILAGGEWVPGGDLSPGGLFLARFLGGDDSVPYPTAAPIAMTGGHGRIDGTTAGVLGIVNPGCTSTGYVFQYGPTSQLGRTAVALSAGAGADDTLVGSWLTDLNPASAYYYRLVAVNANGMSYGGIRSFTTSKAVPRSLSIRVRRVGVVDAIRGRLRTGIARVSCTGNVDVTVRRAGHAIAHRSVRLRPGCTFALRLAMLRRRGLHLQALFTGSRQLTAIRSRSLAA